MLLMDCYFNNFWVALSLFKDFNIENSFNILLPWVYPTSNIFYFNMRLLYMFCNIKKLNLNTHFTMGCFPFCCMFFSKLGDGNKCTTKIIIEK
jgi:hypothetical protein